MSVVVLASLTPPVADRRIGGMKSALLLLPLAAVLLAGCGAAQAPVAQQVAAPSSTKNVQVKPPAPTVVDAGMDAAGKDLEPFLLTPAEIGPGFTAADEPRPDPATPAVCGGPGVVARFPYAVRVGAAAEQGPGLVQETVSVYGDDATAGQAYQATLDGMDCGQGSVGGRSVAIAPAEDLAADLPYDQATGWRVGGAGVDLVMIAVRDGSVIMNFTVLAPEDGLAALPDPLGVAQNGTRKLLG
jgi:hypothetical protein